MSAGDDIPSLTQTKSNAGQIARTETTEVTAAPEFTNRAFVLAVPRGDSPSSSSSSAAAKGGGGGGGGSANANGDGDVSEEPGGINAPGGGGNKVGDVTRADADDDEEGHVPALLCQLFGARSSLSSALGQDAPSAAGTLSSSARWFKDCSEARLCPSTSLSSSEGKQPAQVSLQVTMLDTDMRGPRAGGGGGEGAASAQGENSTMLGVAHRADLPGTGGGRRQGTRRFCRRQDDAGGGGETSVASRDAPCPTRDPVWNEVVTVEVSEGEIDREKVLLAVVNHDTNKLMAKGRASSRSLVGHGPKLLLGGEDGPS